MSLVNFPGPKNKTPSVKTLGVLFFGLLHYCWNCHAFADCMPQGAGEMAVVDRVLDGDTVKLKDGRHVRVLGINTPEIEHGKEKPGQALGEAARRSAQDFFNADKHVRLFYDVQRVDRYERTLAHLYDTKGNSLSAYLLRKGLGFHVAIPPNLSLNECLHAQEVIARKSALGVWNDAYWSAIPASHLSLDDTGFKRVTGRIISVSKSQSVWLELDGPIVLKISPADLKNFSVSDWQSWRGRRVEVRGWVTGRGNNNESQAKRKSGSAAKSPFKPLIIQPRIAGNLDLLPKN